LNLKKNIFRISNIANEFLTAIHIRGNIQCESVCAYASDWARVVFIKLPRARIKIVERERQLYPMLSIDIIYIFVTTTLAVKMAHVWIINT
jgi:hypothetical protein